MAKRIVAILGSYRKNGTIHQTVDRILSAARDAGAETESIDLLDADIGFCTNCRACTQEPGPERGNCPQQDDMDRILDRIECADALVLAAPMNFSAVSAIFKRFMERLVCYAYWPWGKASPVMRRGNLRKPAALVSASAMPALMANFYPTTMGSLKLAAKTLGAKPVAKIHVGLAAMQQHRPLPDSIARRASRAAQHLTI